MNVTCCENGHHFDGDKYKTCPYCKENVEGGEHDLVTVAMEAVQMDMQLSDKLTERYLEHVHQNDLTISAFFANEHIFPTTGWLVCTRGKQYGKTLPIYMGRNFAGRSKQMEIFLGNESWISRENHFSIVYDPKSVRFILVKGTGEIFLNGTEVLSPIELKEDDKISFGEEAEYIFVPYCKEGRTWDEESR